MIMMKFSSPFIHLHFFWYWTTAPSWFISSFLFKRLVDGIGISRDGVQCMRAIIMEHTITAHIIYLYVSHLSCRQCAHIHLTSDMLTINWRLLDLPLWQLLLTHYPRDLYLALFLSLHEPYFKIIYKKFPEFRTDLKKKRRKSLQLMKGNQTMCWLECCLLVYWENNRWKNRPTEREYWR